MVELVVVKIFRHAGAGFLPDHTEAEELALQTLKNGYTYFVAECLDVGGMAAKERQNASNEMRMFLYYDRVAFLRPRHDTGIGFILDSMVRIFLVETYENRTFITYI